MVSASFNVNKADVMALAWPYYSASLTVRKARLWGQLSIPLLSCFFAGAVVYRDPGRAAATLSLLIFAGVWAFAYPKYHNWYLLRNAERMFRESEYQKIFGAYTITLDENGITSSSPVATAQHSWAAVNRVLLTEEHLLIFLVGPSGFPIPRSQVPESTIQEMKAFAEKRIPGNGQSAKARRAFANSHPN